jgi:hypothetical protein
MNKYAIATYINSKNAINHEKSTTILDLTLIVDVEQLFREYKKVFAWSYKISKVFHLILLALH